jgi:hypothetical protein
MCEFSKNIDSIKSSQKKELKEIQLQRQIKLVNELGEPAEKFRIIDQLPMTWELIQEFELAIKTGVPGRPPKKKKVITRPTLGDKYEIRFRYDLREGINGPKILPDGRTRDFCEIILDANRFYTRNDINTLSNGFGLPVFEYAGGYYHNPETGQTTPYCRHNWYMVFVERV